MLVMFVLGATVAGGAFWWTTRSTPLPCTQFQERCAHTSTPLPCTQFQERCAHTMQTNPLGKLGQLCALVSFGRVTGRMSKPSQEECAKVLDAVDRYESRTGQ